MQSENGVEISKVSIRGSGIESDDEPLGVEFLLDGLSFNQGDGEAIIEDFDVSTLKYAEVYRGANAFKYGSLTLGGAINLVPFTGYDVRGVSNPDGRRQLWFCPRRDQRRPVWTGRGIITLHCRDAPAMVIANTARRTRNFFSLTWDTKSMTTWKIVFI